MSLATHIYICILCGLCLFYACLALLWMPDDSKHTSQVDAGLRSARRRLFARHLKAEIRSTSRRFRRELDDELNRIDTARGKSDV
jgi:hypothetical protein